MIAYTMVGVGDIKRSEGFYDSIFSIIGWAQLWRGDRVISWGDAQDQSKPKFCVSYPFNGEAASPGNGVMTAFHVVDPQTIDKIYKVALDNGATDEGAPGLRPEYAPNLYAAYVRDMDGNKLAFVCFNAN